ncbi:hypothetical protein AAFF_G00201780 [Aldrovandia affinis]|uniref:Uncharacterized protein n=1 Tax=Aldrovandia affinis TaxID=143900 RepID=A0AAD7SXZ0_9TELE|nr:hypothetical protein AAFF_G00201780 [Aldrovandia affinis]
MLTYARCLSAEPPVSCWHSACYEEDEELLPLYSRPMGNVPAKPGPRLRLRLRRRLLSAKVHQKQDSLWTPKPLLGPPACCRPRRTLPPSSHQRKGTQRFAQGQRPGSRSDRGCLEFLVVSGSPGALFPGSRSWLQGVRLMTRM